MPATPTGQAHMVWWHDGVEVRYLYRDVADGYLYLDYQASLAALPLDEWVTIDLSLDTSADPHVWNWKINGVAQTQKTRAAAAADMTYIDFKAVSTGIDTWYDDIGISYTAADYPIPAGTVTGTAPEVWTDAPVAPVWTSPADGVAMSTTPVLQFTIPSAASAIHFYLELDTADTFDTANLRTYRSDSDQTNWTYDDGDSWEAVPSGGVATDYIGNDARYTVTSPLSSGTWYRRVRAST